ncbi:MAG: hypothetical protein HY762_03650 [Planctomycetes bacterium]|nr:hypothetical protein [Planctomycetota bacterium]
MKKIYIIFWILLIGLTGAITIIATRKLSNNVNPAVKSTDNKPNLIDNAEFSREIVDLQKEWSNLNIMLNSLTAQAPVKNIPAPKTSAIAPQQSESSSQADDPFAELKKRRAEIDRQQENQNENTPPANPLTEEEQREKQQKFRQRLIETTAQRLNLSDYQQTEFINALAERNRKLSETISRFRSGQTTYDRVRPEVDKIRAEADEKLKTLLTPQQYGDYKGMEGSRMMGRELRGDE